MAPVVRVVRLPHGEGLELPSYQTALAAGCDLRAAVREPIVLAPRERVAVPTGLRLALPPGYEGQVRPRSGRALREGLSMPNAPGTLDADYRGEVKVLLVNLGEEPLTVRRGDRIAQLVVAPVVQVAFEEVEDLDATGRGHAGFGSTGT